MKKSVTEPLTFYFDTNILFDLIKERRQDSIKLFEFIKTNAHKCLISMFAYMELIGLEKTLFYAQRLLLENKKDVFDIIRSYRNCKLNIDELYEIEERIEKAEFFNYIEIQKLIDWEMAKNFILKTNLSTNDCLHLTVASIVSADYIVTSDREFAEQAKDQPILIKRPEEIMKLLNS